MKRLAIVTTHPIQYNAPLFSLLTQRGLIKIKVFYTWGQSEQGDNFDPGFGQKIKWDIPLLEGYEYTFVENTATEQGTHHFKGIINPQLNQEIQAWKPDAVLIFGWSFVSHLKCMRFFHGKVPVLFRGDSTLLDERGGFKKILRRLLLKWIYRHVDFALYTGTNNKAYFKAHGLKDDQLYFAPHAIDNNRFADVHADYSVQAKEWRAQLGFTENDIVMLFAGKLESKKDPGILLKLARQLKMKHLHFLIVGNGKLEQQLKDESADLRNVRFLDFQNQSLMPIIYRLGDIYILPSLGPGETWGLALNEAMACGLPVIASDKVGGAINLIQDGVNGFIFQAGRLRDLQNRLENLLNTGELAFMGNQSTQLIRAWSFDHIIDAIHLILSTDKVAGNFRMKTL